MRRLIFLTTLGCFLFGMLLPWWCMCLVTTLAGLFCTQHWRAMWVGFAASFLLWAGWPVFLHVTGHGVLAPRLSGALHLPWWPLIFLVSGVIGGGVGLLSCWLGYTFKQLVLVDMGKR